MQTTDISANAKSRQTESRSQSLLPCKHQSSIEHQTTIAILFDLKTICELIKLAPWEWMSLLLGYVLLANLLKAPIQRLDPKSNLAKNEEKQR